MKIIVPTYMREERQGAYRGLPDCLKKDVILFTHSGRAPLLKKHNPEAKVVDLGKCDGIADVRQSIVTYCGCEGLGKVMMIDDQCYFNFRLPSGKLSVMDNAKRFHTMLGEVSDMLDDFPQVGISPRPGNNRVTEDYVSPSRSYSCYGLNVASLFSNDICFDGMYVKDNRIKLFEDFYLTLSMLLKGIPNAVLYKYAHYHNHGKDGGNSHYRTSDTQLLCLEALREEFPSFVKLVQKESKTWLFKDGEAQYRWECVVQWKKAYLHGCGKDLL
jgi:hypothetical protein